MTVAVIQMCSLPDLSANLKQAEQLLQQAREQGAQLAVLPENFATFGCSAEQLASAEQVVAAWLSQTAQRLSLWIVAGSVPVLAETNKYYARCWVVNAAGQRVASYDKIHLFDAQVADQQGSYRESDNYQAGQHLTVIDTPVGRLGLAICYDLRFPELFASLRQAGAELIALPSAFTQVTGAAHWEVLVRARAIESQCYLLAAGQAGEHQNGRITYGRSMLVDPWGAILQQAVTEQTVLLASCDLEYLQQVRQQMPVLEHKKTTASFVVKAGAESEYE